MDMVDVFLAAAVLLLFSTIKATFKAKEKKWG
jgi:hypothetical protein